VIEGGMVIFQVLFRRKSTWKFLHE